MAQFDSLQELNELNVEDFSDIEGFFILESHSSTSVSPRVTYLPYMYFTDFPALRKYVKENWDFITENQRHTIFTVQKVGFTA